MVHNGKSSSGSEPSESSGVVEVTKPSVQQQKSSDCKYRVYSSRYYVLVVTALFAMHQNIAWLTFGPIPDEAKERYGLTDAELTLFPGIIGWLVHREFPTLVSISTLH